MKQQKDKHKKNMEMEVKFDAEAREQEPAEIFASIDDLLTAILLRLPILSLIRFKLVSKHWLSLITNPRFCQIRNPNPNPAVGLFLPLPSNNFKEDGYHSLFEYVPFCTQKSSSKLPLGKLNFLSTCEDHQIFGIRILQSCNGFMLCCCSISPVSTNLRYLVYNPTTNKFSTLPKSGVDETNGILKRKCWMNLAFDPVKSYHYSVVCVWSQPQEMDNPDDVRHNSQFQIEIYSSKTASWRLCGNPFTALVNFENGVYWNGSIHWLTATWNGESLYFNTDNQIVRMMPMLPVTYSLHCKRHYYFGESCDHLHFIDMRGPTIKFNVYELNRDYSEWFVKYSVDLSRVVVSYPEMINPLSWCSFIFTVFTVIRGEKEEDSFLVLQILGKAMRYNLVSKTFQNLHEFQGGVIKCSLKYPTVSGFQYIRSLCSVGFPELSNSITFQ